MLWIEESELAVVTTRQVNAYVLEFELKLSPVIVAEKSKLRDDEPEPIQTDRDFFKVFSEDGDEIAALPYLPPGAIAHCLEARNRGFDFGFARGREDFALAMKHLANETGAEVTLKFAPDSHL
jgi:hypothetical protein